MFNNDCIQTITRKFFVRVLIAITFRVIDKKAFCRHNPITKSSCSIKLASMVVMLVTAVYLLSFDASVRAKTNNSNKKEAKIFLSVRVFVFLVEASHRKGYLILFYKK